jgi:hypothetical protein
VEAKPWYASKTLWFNALVFLLALASRYGFNEFQSDPNIDMYVTLFLTIGTPVFNLILRLVTKKPIA